MRNIKLISLSAIIILAASVQIEAQNFQIVPGRSVGPISQTTSEKELTRIFGRQNVKQVNVDVGEGETQPGTVVFPNDWRRKLFILWRDATRQRPERITISGKNTFWKTDRGITIGTTLRTIEELNGGAFALSGFGWDYSGTVLHSNGGRLAELGNKSGEDITGRTLLLRLEPASPLQKTPEYKAVLGDGKFLSDNPAMRKLNPSVYEMIVEFPLQSDAQIEKELLAALKDIQAYSIYGGSYEKGKLTKAQELFEEKLVRFTKSPSTLNYKFSELDDLMFIATSEDGKFRIYSWDLQDGGTMHRFARVYQYRGTEGNVFSNADDVAVEGMGRGFATDIFALDTKDGMVYIVCSTIIGSTKNYFQSAGLYKIEGSALNNNVKLIKTRSGLTNTLGFEYDNFSVIDRKERPSRLITYDNETKTLKIPVVIKDKEFPDGRITNESISYSFNGQYFVRVS